MNNEFNDIIKSLQQLRTVTPSDHFLRTMKAQLSPPPPYSLPFLLARVAFVVLFVFIIGGTGIVAASAQSQPGDILYPVKQLIKKVEITFTPQLNNHIVSTQSPTPTTQAVSSTPTPVPPTPTQQHAGQSNNTLGTQAPTPTPTPTIVVQVTPAVQVQTAVKTPVLPVNVSLSVGQSPSPTSTPTNAGSKDDDRAGTPLLPIVHIVLPIPPIQLGLGKGGE